MSNKAESARINGAKSKGPSSEAGKAISAQNSLKHGLNSSRVVLPHESQDEYDTLEAAFIRRYKPADEVETDLVIEMVAARWRMRRIEIMESALYKKAMREQKELLGPDSDVDDIRDAAYAEVAESKIFRMLMRTQGQLRRAYERAWRELEVLQEDRVAQHDEHSDENEPTITLTPAMMDRLLDPPFTPRERQMMGNPYGTV
jgi:hypothetical protein